MKKFLAIVMTFAVLFGVFSVAFAAEDGIINFVESAEEAPEGYTAIRTAEDLNNIRNDLAGKYILMNDIDLSVYENWVPIGDAENPFTGELDGNGYTIKNLSVDFDATIRRNYVGLFGYCENSIIQNLFIKNASVKAEKSTNSKAAIYLGIVAGQGANLSKVAVKGTASAKGFNEFYVSGLCGKKEGDYIEDCSNYANLLVNADDSAMLISAGGIVGELLNGNAVRCCNYGNIDVKGENVSPTCEVYEGGIIGYSHCQISINEIHDSYNKGDISIDFSSPVAMVGGLAGESGTIINAYNQGEILLPENFSGCAGALAGSVFIPSLAVLPSYLENLYYKDSNLYPAYIDTMPPEDEEDYIFRNVKLITEEDFEQQDTFYGFDFENVWVMSEELGCPIHKNELTFPEEESTTENTTIPEETEPTTVPETSEPSTETTTEKVEISTTIPEPSTTKKEETTQPTTAPVTEPETQHSTVPENTTVPEPTTEPTTAPEETTTEPADDEKCPIEDCWLIKFLKQFFIFICEVVCGILARVV